MNKMHESHGLSNQLQQSTRGNGGALGTAKAVRTETCEKTQIPNPRAHRGPGSCPLSATLAFPSVMW